VSVSYSLFISSQTTCTSQLRNIPLEYLFRGTLSLIVSIIIIRVRFIGSVGILHVGHRTVFGHVPEGSRRSCAERQGTGDRYGENPAGCRCEDTREAYGADGAESDAREKIDYREHHDWHESRQ